MLETVAVPVAAALGALLAAFFFGTLWLTVKATVAGRSPLWLAGSSLLRLAVVGLGFYWILSHGWRTFAAALAGFWVVRWWAIKAAKPRVSPCA